MAVMLFIVDHDFVILDSPRSSMESLFIFFFAFVSSANHLKYATFGVFCNNCFHQSPNTPRFDPTQCQLERNTPDLYRGIFDPDQAGVSRLKFRALVYSFLCSYLIILLNLPLAHYIK